MVLAGAAALSLGGPAAAAETGSSAPAAAVRVYTRAVVRGLPARGESPPLIRLKILPRGKLPFTTLSFRVDDPALLRGVSMGDEVGFIAARRAHGNTLVALRKAAPCVRLRHCAAITD